MKAKDKEKMVEALEDLKEFEVTFSEYVTYSKIFKAKNKEQLIDDFQMGNLDVCEKDMIDGEYQEDSLEIDEVEN